MKVYALNTGYLEADKNGIVGFSTYGTRSNPHVTNEWIKLPVMAYLIETDNGYIVFDTGSNPEAMNGYWPKNMQELYPLYQKKEERLEEQLALCNVKPEDVKTVVLSHMHLDHAGNINLFPHADVYVPEEDYKYALAKTHMNPNPLTHGGYIKGDMERSVKQYHLVDEDFELEPGIDVLCLPGHTPNLLGLVVHLKNQTIILPQDCIYTSEIYGPPAKMSGFVYDTVSFAKSVEKVRKIAKKYNAKVFPAHDWEFFKTMKLAPEYYD